ncbi:MAG: hypothetical protein IT320_18835, partial [Anaerolineae bacterium]|nr:hypothetical protein [Anaerolineae bacterium]
PGAADIFPSTAPVIVPRRETVDAAALKDALVKAEGGDYRFRGYRLTPKGIVEDGAVSEDDWAELGLRLLSMTGRLQWWVGDWALSCRGGWGARYAKVIEATGIPVRTIDEYVYVCKAVDFSLRNANLDFGHHRAVARLDADGQHLWLQWAAQQADLSVARLRQYMAVLADLDLQMQYDWLQWADQEKVTLEELREFVTKWRAENNPTLSQKPPALLTKEQAQALKDVARWAKFTPERLKQTDRAALRVQLDEAQRVLDAVRRQIAEGE